MTLFLFLKQIVDMLYAYRWMDYAMVCFAVVALIYQVALVRPDWRKSIHAADLCILGLMLLVGVRFVVEIGYGIMTEHGLRGFFFWDIINGSGTGVFLKVFSGFLMYFVGRIYAQRILECEVAMALSAYLVVYANLIHRVITFGLSMFWLDNAHGDIYYYDTDLGYAMLTAFILIAMFARNSLGKYITLLVVIPYMVFCSDAGMQKVLLLVLLVLLVLFLAERVGVPRRVGNILLTISLVGLLGVVCFCMLPAFTGDTAGVNAVFRGKWISGSGMAGRYPGWRDAWANWSSCGMPEKLFGISIHSDVISGNQYLKILYGTGLVGVLLSGIFTFLMVRQGHSIRDRKIYYVMVLFAILFFGTGLLVNCMEYTQMSWFFMMFLGMVVSNVEPDSL
ncbi:MAG: hypothetical protein ACI4DU_09605 [Lachnospiraceae bacterium]